VTRPGRLLAALAVAAVAVTGCAGRSCDALPRLQAEREAMREDYLELVRSGASAERTEQADADLHAFEQQVYDAEQRCG